MKPILFQTGMVRAILDGRKTMTRRAVRLQYGNTSLQMRTDKSGTYLVEIENEEPAVKNPDGTTTLHVRAAVEKTPPYCPGDVLYVRETWVNYDGKFYYRADGISYPHYGWKPSIHMPKKAARLFLRVTDVHAERLQDITEADCINDGDFSPEAVRAVGKDTLFKALWDDTIKKADLPLYGWDANPWVWVIAFKKINIAGRSGNHDQEHQ